MYILPDSIQFNPNLSATLKTFLRALAHACGSSNRCWPGQPRIAAFMNCSTRTVQRCEKEALELRLVEVKRRWRKSNIYTVVCLEERKLSTMATQGCRIEQTKELRKQRSNGPVEKSLPWKSPAEIKIMFEDMTEVLGPVVVERNRGWLWKIARATEYDLFRDELNGVKHAVRDSQGSEKPIKSPSALFTWRLRNAGVNI